MDFFEFWFWHRWFHRDDPNYDDSGILGGFIKLMLVFFAAILLMMCVKDCQHENPSDEQQTSQPAEITERTSAKQTATKREEAKVNALAPSAPVAVPASVKLEQKTVTEKTYESRQYIEVYTAAGEVKLYVGMPKDSVKMKMGNPYTTRAFDSPYLGLQETWEYLGRNKYVSEFTIEFLNGRLKSLRQYRER